MIDGMKKMLVTFVHEQSNGAALPSIRLVDVGVSGGIYPPWRAWGEKLQAIGFDCLEDEIETLRRMETHPHIRYEAARLVGTPSAPLPPLVPTNYTLHRAQCYLATRLHRGDLATTGDGSYDDLWRDTFGGTTVAPPYEANYSNIADPIRDPFFGYYARRFARGRHPRITTRSDTLDRLMVATGGMGVDMLKIDTDGYDFDVLRGGERSIVGGCLAVEIEIQFHGPISPEANVFCNIDAFLRERGFTLLRLEPARYGRSALPRPFLYDIPAQTRGGPLQWADAFYARDLVAPSYLKDFGIEPTMDRLRNLALIYDLYGLEDLSAEIVLRKPGLFPGIADEKILDFLARKVHGEGATYRGTIDEFVRAQSSEAYSA